MPIVPLLPHQPRWRSILGTRRRAFVAVAALISCVLALAGFLIWRDVPRLAHRITAQAPSHSRPTPMKRASVSPTPTPTPDPTAGWTTYTSIAGDFTIKYPPGWTAKEVTATQVNLQNEQLAFVVTRGKVSPGAGSPDAVREYTVSVDGQEVPATEYAFHNDPTNALFVYFNANHGEQPYNICWIVKKGAEIEAARTLLRQMLSTFRFID